MEDRLEAAVRAHFKRRFEPMIGQSRHATPEIVAVQIERKTEETVAILRETLSDDQVPTENDLFRVAIEANQRQMRGIVEKMRDPERLARLEGDPWKLEIVRTLAEDAEEAMRVFRRLTPDMTQERLDEASRKLRGHWTNIADKIKPDPPAPQ